MAIPSETIEQVAAANDVVEVIGTYFPLKRAGASFKALCPFHREKTPSFTVSPQRQTFHCFGCGAGGSVFRFVMDYEHLEFPWPCTSWRRGSESRLWKSAVAKMKRSNTKRGVCCCGC